MVNLQIVQQHYDSILQEIVQMPHSSSESKLSTIRRITISKCISSLLKEYPTEQPSILWKLIEKAHVISFISGKITIPVGPMTSNEILDFILEGDSLALFSSASQSWKRASGVAWEEFIKDTINLSDSKKEIIILNAAEMKTLIKGGKLVNKDGISAKLIIPTNDPDYIEFLNKVLDDKNFDLFVLYFFPLTSQWKLFGLIQCKTSIRDRLKINMKSSEEAMQHHLWSVIIAMDSDGFTRNEGQYNRDAKRFWNSFYILDNNSNTDESIYYGNIHGIERIIQKHCQQVLTSLMHQTNSISESWRPKD